MLYDPFSTVNGLAFQQNYSYHATTVSDDPSLNYHWRNPLFDCYFPWLPIQPDYNQGKFTCPQCNRQTRDEFRLVLDTCGHYKCRRCLLTEARGCIKCDHATFMSAKDVSLLPNSLNLPPSNYPMQMVTDLSVVPHLDGKKRAPRASKNPSWASNIGSPPSSMSVIVDETLSLELISRIKDRMHATQNWIETSDFRFIDEDLEWLKRDYLRHKYDALIDTQNILETAQRGKRWTNTFEGEIALPHAKLEDTKEGIVNPTSGTEGRNSKPEAPKADPQECSTSSQSPKETPKGTTTKKVRCILKSTAISHIIKKSEFHPPKYLCTICNRQFNNKLNIRYHVVCADTSAGHPCEKCSRVFKSSSHLTYHMRTVHGMDKPYKCKLCNKEFAQSSKLKRHILTHTGEKPFKCATCDHTFTTKYNLREHQNIHKVGLYSDDHVPTTSLFAKGLFGEVTPFDYPGYKGENAIDDARDGHSNPGSRSPPQRPRCRLCDKEFQSEAEKNFHICFELKQEFDFSSSNLQDFVEHDNIGPSIHAADENFSEHPTVKMDQDLSSSPKYVHDQFNPPKMGGDLRDNPNSAGDITSGYPEHAVQIPNDFLINDLNLVEKGVQPGKRPSPAYKQVKDLLSQIKGNQIFRVVNALSSVERKILIHILKNYSCKKLPLSHIIQDSAGNFSDISTGSKKEFLKRYRRQILEGNNSCSSASTGTFKIPANSISAIEHHQLLDEQVVTEEDYRKIIDFPVPAVTDAQVDGTFEVIMKNIQNLIQSQTETDGNEEENLKNNESVFLSKSNDGLRKVVLFEDPN